MSFFQPRVREGGVACTLWLEEARGGFDGTSDVAGHVQAKATDTAASFDVHTTRGRVEKWPSCDAQAAKLHSKNGKKGGRGKTAVVGRTGG